MQAWHHHLPKTCSSTEASVCIDLYALLRLKSPSMSVEDKLALMRSVQHDADASTHSLHRQMVQDLDVPVLVQLFVCLFCCHFGRNPLSCLMTH